MFFLEFGVRLVFWVSKLWVSDSSKAVSVVSKDLQEVLQSNFDELPRSLKHLSKITRSEEFTNSVVRVSQALIDGILRGYGIENKSEIEEVGGLNFVDKVMDRMMGTVGTRFDQQKFRFFYIHVKKPIETQIVVQVACSSVICALYSKISGLEVFCRIKLAARSIVEFFTLKLSENMKRSVDIVHEEVVERGLDVITQINAKSYVILTVCLALFLHILESASSRNTHHPINDDEGSNMRDDIDRLLHDMFRNVDTELSHGEGVGERLPEDATKFFKLLEKGKQHLYLGCENFSKQSFTIRLFLFKSFHELSNAAFLDLLVLIKEAFPFAQIPESFNKAKNVIRDLGLDYEKLHACPNDCSYSGRTMRKLRFVLYVGLLDGRVLVVPQPMQALKFLQRYQTEEEESILNLSPIFPKNGHLIGCEKKKDCTFFMDAKLRYEAHRYVLFNTEDEEVEKFIEEHKNSLSNHTISNVWLRGRNHSREFSSWFEERVKNIEVSLHLKWLSSAYFINGYRFHTKNRYAPCKTQNSGVTLSTTTDSFASARDQNPIDGVVVYYGVIQDIIEIDYYGSFSAVLFRCDWHQNEVDEYGLTREENCPNIGETFWREPNDDLGTSTRLDESDFRWSRKDGSVVVVVDISSTEEHSEDIVVETSEDEDTDWDWMEADD
ncbi:hypothetical protein FXO38_08500 [Capsicum annuum]|nr:hypothetical protein FXO38_08500 [Capsicum annuum]